MKTSIQTTLTAAVLGVSSIAMAAAFTPGNLVVVRVGDGSAALNSNATAFFLDEYTKTGSLVQSIPVPTTTSGDNRRMTISGSATSEGFLSLSTNGQFLTFVGYDAAPGTASVVGSASSAINKVVARVGINGAIDSTTIIADAISQPRSSATVDGSGFWVVGNGSATAGTGGVRYVPYGSTGATVDLHNSTPANNRVVNLFGGNIYYSAAGTNNQYISLVSGGLATTSGQTAAMLPGFPTATGPSAYDFVFTDANTVYIADDRTGANSVGLMKWTLSGGSWSLAYNTPLPPAAGTTNQGLRGLTFDNGVFYATTTDNRIVSILDTGSGFSYATVATAAINTTFRGVELTPIPEPAALGLLAPLALTLLRRR